jgi:putative glycosyltransferase (TIGR04372 family)
MTNWVSLGTPPWYGPLFLPKLYWSEAAGRYLTIEEIIRGRLGHSQRSEKFSGQGVRLVENTAEEINEVVLEMLARFEGKPGDSPADENLQHRFRQLATRYRVVALSRIGRDYFRKHAFLLEPGEP